MPPTTEQTELVAILVQRNGRLKRIYSGCLRVYCQEDHPDRFALAAHAMRELLAKCPILNGEEQFRQGDSMGSRVEPVKIANQALKKAGYAEGTALDVVAGAVRELLNKVDEFLQWMQENRPKNETKIAKLLSGLSGPGQKLPVDIAKAEVKQWKAANDYFNDVAHHQRETNETEFLHHMTFIETLLRQRLRPPAVADHDDIDALVAEAEHGN